MGFSIPPGVLAIRTQKTVPWVSCIDLVESSFVLSCLFLEFNTTHGDEGVAKVEKETDPPIMEHNIRLFIG